MTARDYVPLQLDPTVSRETLAWLNDDGNASGHLNLNWFAGSGGGWVTFESSSPLNPPAVPSDGRLIVWTAEMDGTLVLRMVDTAIEEVQEITGEEAVPAYPVAYGNSIVRPTTGMETAIFISMISRANRGGRSHPTALNGRSRISPVTGLSGWAIQTRPPSGTSSHDSPWRPGEMPPTPVMGEPPGWRGSSPRKVGLRPREPARPAPAPPLRPP